MSSDIAALIERAIEEERAERELADDGHDWPAAEVLGRSAGALSAASSLAGSADPLERSVAAHVLGAMVDGRPEHVTQAMPVLTALLASADHPHLQYSVAEALRLTWDASAIEPLLRLEHSPLEGVRESVAQGLHGAMSSQVVPAGIDALARLSRDSSPSVRDWATFALSELHDDSEPVRRALWDRVDDPDYDTRCEALAGLARRHDRGLVDRVAAELRADSVGRLVVKAAAELGTRHLLEPLLALQEWWDVDPELLAAAIEASSGSSP